MAHPGPSRTIVVEPLRLPAEQPVPAETPVRREAPPAPASEPTPEPREPAVR